MLTAATRYKFVRTPGPRKAGGDGRAGRIRRDLFDIIHGSGSETMESYDEQIAREIKDADIELREWFACKVCGCRPDYEGYIYHSRGCYVVSEDGGGSEYIPETDASRGVNL